MNASAIPFIDLKTQRDRIRDKLDIAINRVIDHAGFIMGPEVAELEEQLAKFCGVEHALTCSSGTDALFLLLLAKNIGPGDVVFAPAFTFVAAVEASVLLGATPYFVDVSPDSYNMDPESLKDSIVAARKMGLRPAAVVAVDLYGQPADYRNIEPLVKEEGLFLIEDAAQSFGASLEGVRTGSFGDAAGTSFFPAKPLGCYGDGGAVLTDDSALANTVRQLRSHGQAKGKYNHVHVGMTGRLDTIQAAVLLEKLTIFEDEISKRALVAERYTEALADICKTPVLANNTISAWAQYTLQVEKRDQVVASLSEAGIPTAVHYPRPVHHQSPYNKYPMAPKGLNVSEFLSTQVLSLPMHPYLDTETQDRIITAVRAAIKNT